MEPQTPDFTRQLGALWRRKWLIAAIAAVTLAVALGYSAKRPMSYEAAATVIVQNRNDPLSFLPESLRMAGPTNSNITTQVEVMKSRTVLEAAARKLHPELTTRPEVLALEASRLRAVLTTQRIGNTDMLEVRTRASTADLAQRQVSAIVEAYVETVRESQVSSISASLEKVSRKIEQLGGEQLDPSITSRLARLGQDAVFVPDVLLAVSGQLQQIQREKTEPDSGQGLASLIAQATTISGEVDEVAQVLREMDKRERNRLETERGQRVATVRRDIGSAASALNMGTARLGNLPEKAASPAPANEWDPLVQRLASAITTLDTAADGLDNARRSLTNLPLNEWDRLAQRLASTITTLDTTADGLDNARRSLTNLPLDAPLAAIRDRVKAASGALQGLSQQLGQAATREEKAISEVQAMAIQDSVRSVAVALGVVADQIAKLRAPDQDPLLYGQLMSLEERLRGVATTLRAVAEDIRPPLLDTSLAAIRDRVKAASGALQGLSQQLGQAATREEKAISEVQAVVIQDSVRSVAVAVGVVADQIAKLRAPDQDPLFYGQLMSLEERLRGVAITLRAVAEEIRLALRTTPPPSLREQLLPVRDSLSATAAALVELSRDVERANQGTAGQWATMQGQLGALAISLEVAYRSLERLRTGNTLNMAVYGELAAVEALARQAGSTVQGVSRQLAAFEEGGSSPYGQMAAIEQRAAAAAQALGEVISRLQQASPRGAVLLTAEELGTVQEQLGTTRESLELASRQLDRIAPKEQDSLTSVQVTFLAERVRRASSALEGISTNLPRAMGPPTPSPRQALLSTASQQTGSAATRLRALSQQLLELASGKGPELTRATLISLADQAGGVAVALATISTDVEKLRQEEADALTKGTLLTARERLETARGIADSVRAQLDQLQKGGALGLGYAELTDLQQKLRLAEFSAGSGGTQVMDRSTFPPDPKPYPLNNTTLFGGVAGLLVGVLAALAIESADRRIKYGDQVRTLPGLPLLGQIPRVKVIANPSRPSVLSPDSSVLLEAFRLLRTSLGPVNSHGKGRALLITSPGRKEGKTSVAANLALVLTLQGKKVLLVDANARKPDVASFFHLPEGHGLAHSLAQGEDPLQWVSQVNGLDILPWGDGSARSVELLSLSSVQTFLHGARDLYDVIILDGAPIIGFAETQDLAKVVDGVVLAAKANSTTLEELLESKQLLQTAGATLVGCVLNRVDPKRCRHLDHRAYQQHGPRERKNGQNGKPPPEERPTAGKQAQG